MSQHSWPLNLNGRSIVNWLEYRKKNSFSIGDYLVKKLKQHASGDWKIEKFNSSYPDNIYRKYKVIKIDEYGIPHVVQVLYPNGYGKNAMPICNCDLKYEKYELDPEYETHLLLGDGTEYDSMEQLKEIKKARNEK